MERVNQKRNKIFIGILIVVLGLSIVAALMFSPKTLVEGMVEGTGVATTLSNSLT